jgi:hypothetical protein
LLSDCDCPLCLPTCNPTITDSPTISRRPTTTAPKPHKLYRRQHILPATTLELPYMLVPLVPIYRYSPDRMTTESRESSLTAVVAPGSRSVSPKRKYTEAMTLPSRLPTLNVDVPNIASDAYYLSEGKCDSPRSRVAEELEALEIHQQAEEDAPRKRVKTDRPQPAASKLTRFDVTPKQPPRLRFDLPQEHRSEAVLEIAETRKLPERPRHHRSQNRSRHQCQSISVPSSESHQNECDRHHHPRHHHRLPTSLPTPSEPHQTTARALLNPWTRPGRTLKSLDITSMPL